MKIKYNIFYFIPRKKEIEYKGTTLSTRTLQTLLSFITNKYIYNRNEGEYVEIMASKFHRIVSDYKPYLEYMKDMNIIIIDYKYEVGKSSRRYAFNNYFKENAEIIEMVNDSEYKYNRKHICIEPDVLEHLEKDYKSINVNDNYIEKKSKTNKDGIEIYNFKSYITNMVNIKLLKDKRGYFNLDYRIYNPFVFLSEDVRTRNITFNSKLTNLDIRSSFPLFLAVWCVNNGIEQNYEYKEYIEGLKEGTFYLMLADKLNNVKDTNNKTDISKPYYSKGSAKIAFSTWLNGDNVNKNGQIRNDDINYVFNKYFNSIMDMIIKHKKDRNTFYFLLAELEADFIFNTICKRLYKEIKGIRILTCHDAIYFEGEYLNQVEKIWNQELQKLYDKIGLIDIDTTEKGLSYIFEINNFKSLKKERNDLIDDLLK